MRMRSARKRKFSLSPDHVALLSAFNEHKVKYLVVGGYAVGFHSEPRATKDLDVFVKVDDENSHAVFQARASFGAPLDGLKPVDFRDGDSFYQMGFPPEQVDVLQRIDGVDFDACWESRVEALINGTILVPIISVDQLILNKLAAARPRDLLDVEEIREAQAAVPAAAGDVQTVILSGWETGFKKVACTKLLQKRLGFTLSEAKAATDSLLEGQAIRVLVGSAEFDRLAFDIRNLGVRSITREIPSIKA